MESDTISLWVIYDHPLDYPEHWVVREQCVSAAKIVISGDCSTWSTLQEAREKGVPPGLVNVGRMKTDDPNIKETFKKV